MMRFIGEPVTEDEIEVVTTYKWNAPKRNIITSQPKRIHRLFCDLSGHCTQNLQFYISQYEVHSNILDQQKL